MSEGGKGSSLAFGQVVIGPPGSGKTTYCHGMQEFMGRIGRKVTVVNLDPANEAMPYQCAVDIAELITLPDVMENLKLGPNGGLIYCMEYLEANFDWLQEKLAAFGGHYYLFDCPGQVELYTHHDALKNVFAQLAKWNFRVGLGLPREPGSAPGTPACMCKGLAAVHRAVRAFARGYRRLFSLLTCLAFHVKRLYRGRRGILPHFVLGGIGLFRAFNAVGLS